MYSSLRSHPRGPFANGNWEGMTLPRNPQRVGNSPSSEWLSVEVRGNVRATFPENPPHTAAYQVNFVSQEVSTVGHSSSPSETPGRYCRSVCANGFLWRNALIRRIFGWRAMVPPFHLTQTAPGDCRAGKSPTEVGGSLTGDAAQLPTLPTGSGAPRAVGGAGKPTDTA